MHPHALEPVAYTTQPGRWHFVLTQKLVVNLGLGLKGFHEFVANERGWGHVFDDSLVIYAGYASDGCSPTYIIPGTSIRLGTPSPASSAAGFFVHDFMRQFLNLPCRPWTRAQTDSVFYDLMSNDHFPLAAVYYAVVAGPLGDMWLHASKPGNCRCALHTSKP